jgi:hypothetical protein
VKHTQIKNDKNVAHFAWAEIQTWLQEARELVTNFKCDRKVFVMVTNKEMRSIQLPLPDDLILVHQNNLESFFAPCFLASARLAKNE